MPGYVIHIATAQEYLKKHRKEYSIDFINGTIAPDLTNDKQKTHYGKSPAYTSLNAFATSNKIDTDYNKGFFLHLVTDYLFYNKYLEKIEKPQLYYDYDFTNKSLKEKYNVELLEEIEDKVFFKNGKPQILTFELACKVIDEISEMDLDEIYNEAKRNNNKWNKYKKLV